MAHNGHILGTTRPELARLCHAQGLSEGQISVAYRRLFHDGGGQDSLPDASARVLSERFRWERPSVTQDRASSDGTRKWLFRFADGQQAETVYIPEEGRGTLCVSSQVGCSLTCSFCHTGTQKFMRNLGAEEIALQLVLARDALADWPATKADRRITNIVFMGQGEPLYNLDNVARAIDVISDGDGLALSRRKITVSTSGVVPQLRALGERTRASLAISLHAVRDDVRDVLVPINKRWPIATLLDAVRNYPGLSNARRVLFEYVMLDGINDSVADAQHLVALCRDLPCKVNLIPFNPWPGSTYAPSLPSAIEAFRDTVASAGIPCPVRATRGQDILAACGQLKSSAESKAVAVRRQARQSKA